MAELQTVMRPADAALFLTLSKQRLARLRLEGGGPKFCKAGRSILYRSDDLVAWLEANRRGSTSDNGTTSSTA